MRIAPLITVVLSVVLAGCTSTGGGDRKGGEPTERLSNLTSVDELRTQFNADRGEPRLLLLLSPT
jgi:hypothetical protein